MKKGWLLIAAVFVLILWPVAPAAAQVRYKDDEGVTHFVNSIDEVPERYRRGAVGEPVPETKPSDSIQGAPARPPASGSRVPALPGTYVPAVPKDLGHPVK